MAEHKLVGIPKGHVDTEKDEIHFTLNMSDREPLSFVARYGAAAQVISSLGRMFLELQKILRQKNKMESIAAEELHSTVIYKEKFSDRVILQIVTDKGVPYTFALPTKDAADIADQLKTESAKPTQTGHA